MTEIECVGGKIFKVKGRNHEFSSLQCANEVLGDLSKTSVECGKETVVGKVIKIGFASGEKFISQIEVCRNENTASTLYTKHTLYSSNRHCENDDSENFKTDNLETDVVNNINTAYKHENQIARFNRESVLLGNRIRRNMFHKGHLTPRCDAQFPLWKSNTMFYFNSAPQMNTANLANWKRIEGMIRSQAEAMRTDLEVYTGTHEKLVMDDVSMTLLGNGKVDVPKFIWKIVRDPITRVGIAFVVYNSVDSDTFSTTICNTNICGSSGWSNGIEGILASYEKGAIQCCNVNDLMREVKQIPNAAATIGVLNCNKEIVCNGKGHNGAGHSVTASAEKRPFERSGPETRSQRKPGNNK